MSQEASSSQGSGYLVTRGDWSKGDAGGIAFSFMGAEEDNRSAAIYVGRVEPLSQQKIKKAQVPSPGTIPNLPQQQREKSEDGRDGGDSPQPHPPGHPESQRMAWVPGYGPVPAGGGYAPMIYAGADPNLLMLIQEAMAYLHNLAIRQQDLSARDQELRLAEMQKSLEQTRMLLEHSEKINQQTGSLARYSIRSIKEATNLEKLAGQIGAALSASYVSLTGGTAGPMLPISKEKLDYLRRKVGKKYKSEFEEKYGQYMPLVKEFINEVIEGKREEAEYVKKGIGKGRKESYTLFGTYQLGRMVSKLDPKEVDQLASDLRKYIQARTGEKDILVRDVRNMLYEAEAYYKAENGKREFAKMLSQYGSYMPLVNTQLVAMYGTILAQLMKQ